VTDQSPTEVVTALCYSTIPALVEADPAAPPLTLARKLTSEMTDAECRKLLNYLLAQRIATAQQVYAHQRHLVSEHDCRGRNGVKW
jgi:hypothetical protein